MPCFFPFLNTSTRKKTMVRFCYRFLPKTLSRFNQSRKRVTKCIGRRPWDSGSYVAQRWVGTEAFHGMSLGNSFDG